jgi:uncharacterized protein YjbJ (UPF0337 family)
LPHLPRDDRLAGCSAVMNYVTEFDAEVLSYRAFRDREALRAWQERRREHYRRRAEPGSVRTSSSLFTQQQERSMDINKDRISGNWHQLKGKVKEQWGKLTDDDLRQLEGHAERLAGKIQEHYGVEKADAERQAKEFRARHNWN